MVKVWYEPPPGGPRTHLNRGGYYVESARTPAFITKMSKARPITVIVPAIAAIGAMCYIPLSKYLFYDTENIPIRVYCVRIQLIMGTQKIQYFYFCLRQLFCYL